MGEATSISWTKSTWNPWQGCLKISPGCKFCYMYRDKARYGQDPRTVVRSKPPTFNKPLSWKEPGLVFTCSWSDWFIEQADAWRDEAWEIVRRTPHLTYQILTKRPENIAARLPKDWGRGYANVWLGVSVEEQRYADERIPLLLKTPAAIRFLSVEPQLGPVDLAPWLNAVAQCSGCGLMTTDRRAITGCKGYCQDPTGDRCNAMPCPGCARVHYWTGSIARLGWVICGGESGVPDKTARPFDLEWARSLRDQCRAAGVAYFLKQLGADPFDSNYDSNSYMGPAIALADRAGADPGEWPSDLRIQQFPEVRP